MQVMHVKTSGREVKASADSSLPWITQDVQHGWFSYYAPGSGVYMNTGNTVAAENKLALLHYFGCVYLCTLSYVTHLRDFGRGIRLSTICLVTAPGSELRLAESQQLDVLVMKSACD